MDKTFLIEKLFYYRTRIQTKSDAMKMRGLKNVLFIIPNYFPINFNIFGHYGWRITRKN